MKNERVSQASFLRTEAWSLRALVLVMVGIALSTAVRIFLAKMGATLFFAPYFPALIVVSVVAGAPAGFLMTVLTTIYVWWAFMPPVFAFGPLRGTDLANFITFWVSALATIIVAHVYRRTLAALHKSEKARELLVGELRHRAGNSLAVMQAIIKGTVSNDNEKQLAIGRIQALARANDLVSKAHHEHLSLSRLIQDEAAAYAAPNRLDYGGPQVDLDGETARSLALVLHELLTNAVKYGALKNEDGKLLIRWSFENGECLLRWKEVDGPAVVIPKLTCSPETPPVLS